MCSLDFISTKLEESIQKKRERHPVRQSYNVFMSYGKLKHDHEKTNFQIDLSINWAEHILLSQYYNKCLCLVYVGQFEIDTERAREKGTKVASFFLVHF